MSSTRRWRSALVAFLVVLSGLGVLVSTVSVWAHRTIFNTDQWVATVGPLAKNEAVIRSVSTHVTDQLNSVIKPGQRAQDLLPPKLEGLAQPIGAAVEHVIEASVSAVLHSETFQEFWIRANRTIQPRVAAALEGKQTKFLTTANGTIQLNLLPLISQVLRRVQSRAPGLLGAAGPIPTITSSTPVDEARSELAQALGRSLPANFGTVTLLHSTQLATAQQLVRWFNRLIVALVILTVAAMIAAVVLARRRLRAAVAVALSMAAAMGAAIALTRAITNQIASAIANGEDRAAVRSTIGQIVHGLNEISIVLIAIGVVGALIAFLSGPSGPASAIRHHSGRLVSRMTGGRSERAAPPTLIWVARHRTVLWVLGLAVAVIVLATAIGTWVGALVTAAVLAFFEGLVAWMAAAGRERVGAPGGDGAASQEASSLGHP